jgi:DNA-binding MarR family transcriptional regulator
MDRAGADGHPPDGTSAEVLEISGLALELVHAASRGGGPSGRATGSNEAHGSDVPAVSRQAIRACIELYQRGDLTMGELAAHLGMSPGWASRVVEELVAAGFVERRPDPEDRRIVHVRVSPGAREVVEAAYRWRVDAFERALAGIDEAGRRSVRAFLVRLIEELSGPPTP